MIPLQLWYSNEQVEGDVVRTHDELDASIDRIARQSGTDWPALAEVTQFDGDRFAPMLYLGLHVDQGAVMFPDDAERMYTVGVGGQDGSPLLYMQGSADCEFPPNAEVPVALIRQAAHEFADTGRRPTCVRWQVWDRLAS